MIRREGFRRTRSTRRYHDQRDPAERRKSPVERFVRKILVTGDRDWNDVECVVEKLKGYRPETTIVVHGACQGADTIADVVAKAYGYEVRSYPAAWKAFGTRAGPIRNQEMLDKEHRPDEPIDLVLAFHRNLKKSKGTRHMLEISKAAGIEQDITPQAEEDDESRS